ncbi:hypothetical protein [Kitasatospora sp. NPDC058046]|uniref:VG15 protein n=1 Tax=Kitasatospora sp. NPDC058046 TaxID=3346312 RepID=UPI0036DAE987
MVWTPRNDETVRAVDGYQRAQQALAADFATCWAGLLAEAGAREITGSLTLLEAEYTAVVRRYAEVSRVLSIAFYRLVRALETGRVIGGSGYLPGASLGSLWEGFNKATGKRTGSGPYTPLPVDPYDLFPARPLEREAGQVEEVFRREVADRLARRERDQGRKSAGGLDAAALVAWEKEFLEALKSGSTGAGAMVVQDGGRNTVHAALHNDPGAIGYYRKTGSSPCYFCALMASRGAVYKSRGTAAFGPHSRCHCQVVPIFSRRYQLPAENTKYARMWHDFGGGSLADWRTYYASRSSGR